MLCLGGSHLHENKFRYSFQGAVSPLCDCGKDIEAKTNSSNILYYANFHTPRQTLLNNIINFKEKFIYQDKVDVITKVLSLMTF